MDGCEYGGKVVAGVGRCVACVERRWPRAAGWQGALGIFSEKFGLVFGKGDLDSPIIFGEYTWFFEQAASTLDTQIFKGFRVTPPYGVGDSPVIWRMFNAPARHAKR
jgi:hypothetical protein